MENHSGIAPGRLRRRSSGVNADSSVNGNRPLKLVTQLCSLTVGAAVILPAITNAEPVWNVRTIPLERVSVVAHRGAGFWPRKTPWAL